MAAPQAFLKYVDDNQEPFIKRLAHAVSIQR